MHGSKGMLSAGNALESLVQVAGPSGYRTAPARHFFLERYEEAYFAEMAHFVEAISNGRPLRPNAIDGLRAQCLADAAAKSLETGQPIRPAI